MLKIISLFQKSVLGNQAGDLMLGKLHLAFPAYWHLPWSGLREAPVSLLPPASS